MNGANGSGGRVASAVGVLAAVEAAALLVGALTHLGIEVPLGVAVLSEPRVLPAAVVETGCGLLLGFGAYAVLTRRRWAWPAAVAAHAVAIAGILLGIASVAVGAGPYTPSNALFHRVLLVTLVGGLVGLALPAARGALGRSNQPS